MDRRRATWDGYAILILLVTGISLSILTPYPLVILFAVLLLIIHQVLLRLIFSGPDKRSLPFFQTPIGKQLGRLTAKATCMDS